MAQLPLTGADRGRRALHIPHDDNNQQNKGGDRQGDKRQDARNDCAARAGRLPCQADHWIAVGIGQRDDVLVVGSWRQPLDHVEVIELKLMAGSFEKTAVDVFDRKHDGSVGVPVGKVRRNTHGNGRDDCRLA